MHNYFPLFKLVQASQPVEKLTQICLVLKNVWILNVQYSDSHCIVGLDQNTALLGFFSKKCKQRYLMSQNFIKESFNTPKQTNILNYCALQIF
jgi:hypothetical protein